MMMYHDEDGLWMMDDAGWWCLMMVADNICMMDGDGWCIMKDDDDWCMDEEDISMYDDGVVDDDDVV